MYPAALTENKSQSRSFASIIARLSDTTKGIAATVLVLFVLFPVQTVLGIIIFMCLRRKYTNTDK